MAEILKWSFIAATVTSALTWCWATAVFAASRRAMQEEMQHWQAEAIRARELAAQLKQQVAMWSKGCQQGRKDVISILPLLVAAQERLSARPAIDPADDY